ncbi:methyltransferase-like protein 13 [Chenopodium quinoa]|uniref:methyltransferase-like protein 13 n=1 Tax=Chenopodium quinoa TaxID=63459 RepID=UPI000B77EA06|nr:methyltransferase-like protein 13 [Chenopodium quinoa]
MGKKKSSQNPKPQQEELLSTLGDFTKKENWDKFFTLRGSDDSFEWYADWPQLKPPLFSLLSPSTSTSSSSSSENLQILVPGCGNSRLSEQLYDAGFHDITNLDFSKVVISDMLRRNVRDRPHMRWRVMDITSMQFADETYDVVLDKGGLDALMEPEFGSKLGDQYLSEVKRVLKPEGKFICLTLAESHVLGLLFPKFRIGWKVTLHCVPQKPSSKPSLSTFMVVAVKGDSSVVDKIVSSFDHSSIDCNKEQIKGLNAALEAENEVRQGHLDGSDLLYSLEDLKLVAKGDMMELSPGRRVQLVLGGVGSLFRYRAVVLDAQPQSLPFSYHCGVLLVPKTRVREWLFTSEEGQWMVVESAKAARLIIIFLNSSHANLGMEEIQKDLSPLVKLLEPENHDSGAQIPFMTAGDGIKHRKIVHEVTSKLTGQIVVEDVIYENVDENLASICPSKEPVFRRLIFQRTESLVQSEALLLNERSEVCNDVNGRKESPTTAKSNLKEKEKTKKSQQSKIDELNNNVVVDHTFVASSYHTGIVAGFTLILPYLESMVCSKKKVETVVIGLGAGLLPMLLHNCIDFLQIEAVELDPVMLSLAKEYFGFCEDDRLKVHLADGIQFLQNFTISSLQERDDIQDSISGSSVASNLRRHPVQKFDIIIVDVDSSDSSSGLSCPAADFAEDSFFATVKDVLSEQGLFIINLVSRSPSIKEVVVSRMRAVFSHLYCLQLEGDVNEVVFAANSNMCVMDNSISEAALQFQKLLKFENPERSQGIVDMAKQIKRLN